MADEVSTGPSSTAPHGEFEAPSAIVGVGASAGGLDPLKALFSRLEPSSGLAFIVVQHLSPDHESLLSEILEGISPIPVISAEHGMKVSADTVYVMPPGHLMTIATGVLQLEEAPPSRTRALPIDIFLRSLASDQHQDAIAVILSGAGADGAQGIRDIKEHGGVVFVQNPDEATHDSMPRNAILSNQVDYVLDASKISQQIVQYVRHNSAFRAFNEQTPQDEWILDEIIEILANQTDHDFRSYKKSTMFRRALRRMGLRQIPSPEEYLTILRSEPDEVEALAQDLLICVTSFFRDRKAWDELRTRVLEPMINAEGDTPIRIWVPGCATGEEPYGLAMMCCEILDGRQQKVQIFATDISNHALTIARAAVYPETIVNDVGPERLEKFFIRHGTDGYRMSKGIREMVVFAAQDLKSDAPFSRLDLISCRNLLIYLEADAQESILRKLHFALRPGGYLFLGSAESPARLADAFQTISKKSKIYRRKGRQSVLDLPPYGAPFPPRRKPHGTDTRNSSQGVSLREIAADAIIDVSDAAVALVNDRFQPLYLAGDLEQFFEVPAGEQRNNLLDMARPGLHLKLRSALKAAIRDGEVARFQKAKVTQPDGEMISVSGQVSHLHGEDGGALIFVRLEKETPPEELSSETSELESDESPEEIVRALESELHETQLELTSTIQELEQAYEELRTIHEEAMSANEELQAGTEELEASKEELQSLNEELTTVNAQLEEKIIELESANNDLDNLISSTRIPVLFLDTDLCIRSFTPEAVEQFHLFRTDVGRPVTEVLEKFDDDGLIDDAREVLKNLAEVATEVVAANGKSYIRRVLPYRTHDNRIEGVVATFSEITQLKEAERRIKERERELRLVTNNLPVLIAYVDHHEVYQFANATYRSWFGLEPAQIIGRTVREVVGEKAYDEIRKNIHKTLSGEAVTWTGELAYNKGGSRYVQVDYIPHRDQNDEVIGYYALIQDISARKEAEDRLARSEEEYRAIFELAGSGKAQADTTTGQFRRVNRRFCEITGYSAEELLEMSFVDITHPEDRDLDIERVERVKRGEQERWQSEKRYIRKDGEIVWVLVSGTLLRGVPGAREYTVATIQDITPRKHAQQELEKAKQSAEARAREAEESEERFRTLADNISQFAWIADADGSLYWYNKRWFDFTGTTLDEMKGSGWQKVHHPDHVDRVTEKFRRHVEMVQPWEDIFPLRSSQGEYQWFLSRAMPIRDDDGRVVRWFGTNTDITQQMRMEGALMDADRRKDEFLATLAHELRNPLAPIRSGLELLQQGADGESVEQIREMMQRQTSQLIRLVDDLLDVSRITRGKLSLIRERVSLASVIRTAVESMEPLVTEEGHQLVVPEIDDSVVLEGDPTRLAQIFSNLISNACKYTPPPGKITIEAAATPTDVTVAVIDDGNGIPPEMRDRIFDMFTQIEDPLDKTHAGLGIGLTLVKSLVELHDGSISVESEVGQGSTFRVTLPRSSQTADVAKSPPRRESYRKLDILVVDDNDDAALLMMKLLTADGHTVRTANGGRAALDACLERQPEVVLLDLGMPGMNGYDVARELRSKAWGDSVLLIALTGWGQEEDRRKTSEAGFDHHLVKPVAAADLRELLRTFAPKKNNRPN